MEERVATLETGMAQIREEVGQIRLTQDKILNTALNLADLTAKNMEAVIANADASLSAQSNSLSIPLLRDVLVPIVMRLFMFFGGLVIALIGAILGIKWIASDLLTIAN